MAAVNFPNSPSVNDTHTSSGSTWKWDGTVWQRLGVAGPQGAQGVQGATGSGGAAGAQGAQGRQGAAGSNGAAGAQGAQGHQGVQGAANATTINNNANNRIITGSGTANTLEAESDFTWDDSAKRLVVGSQIVRIGDSAGSNSGSRSTTVGNSAGNNSGSYSVNIGNNTGSGAGSYSVNIGANSVGSNAGQYSVSIGGNAVGYSNPKTGSINIGSQYAGYSNAGEHCINIGYSAGYNSGGKYGVNIGYSAGHSQGSSNQGNVAIGYHALKHENGNEYCVGIGNSCYLPIKGENTGASDNQLVIGVGHTAWIVGTKSYNIGLGATNPRAHLSLGGGVDAIKMLLYDNDGATNEKYGFGIQNSELRQFFPSNAAKFTIGTISSSDGSTWSEKLRLTSDGKVGIKNTSPQEMLHVGDGSGTTGGLKVAGQSSSVTDDGLTIDWTASNEARLFSESSGDATMHFYTTSSGTRGERVRITSTGQLLVGTTSSSEQFHFLKSHNSHTRLVVQNNWGGNATAQLKLISPTDEFALVKYASGDAHVTLSNSANIIYNIGGSERLRIDSSGRLGINQTSPTAKLHIVESTSTAGLKVKAGTASDQTADIWCYNDNDQWLALGVWGSSGSTSGLLTANDGLVGSNNDLCLYSTNASGNVKFGAGSSYPEHMRITSNGRVLIGSTSASTSDTYLEVKNTASHNEVNIISKNTHAALINLGDTDSYNQGRIKYDNSDHTLTFRTSAADRFRLATNSNSSSVGSFGTTTSHYNNCTTPDRASFKVGGRLHVEGAFGHNAMCGLYYNCYSGGNDLFYGGTYTPSGGDGRASAITMRYGGVAVMVDNSSTAYSPTNQITTMQTALNVDREGRVTTPKTPSFFAQGMTGSTYDSGTMTGGNVSSTGHNIGSHYNTSTGVFTAPVAGRYLTGCGVLVNSGSGRLEGNISKNNSTTVVNFNGTGTTYDGPVAVAVVELSANDTLRVKRQSGNAYDPGHGQHYFFAHLIG